MTPRPNQTEIAVLGALSVAPLTGYQVRETIRDVLGHFWSESFGQIYPTLARLEAEGLIRRGGADRTGSSTFSLTPAGAERLRERLGEPVVPQAPRNGLMLRLFFGRQLGSERCRALVVEARDRAQATLATFAAIRDEIAGEAEHTADAPFWLITVSAGEHSARATVAWADETLDALDELEGSGRGGRRRRER
jgi:DNA-binding PadR family transcriptional regulator